jgi:Protein of unknown function (DUF2726)
MERIPEVKWEEIDSVNKEPETLAVAFELLFIKENLCSFDKVDESSIYYFSNRLMEVPPKEANEDLIDVFSWTLYVSTFFVLKKEYSTAYNVMEWFSVQLPLKWAAKNEINEGIYVYAAVLYSFAKSQVERLSKEDILYFAKLTFGKLDSSVHFSIELSFIERNWRAVLTTNEFFGWSFGVLAIFSEEIADVFDLPSETVLERYLDDYINMSSMLRLDESELLNSSLKSVYSKISNNLLENSVEFFKGTYEEPADFRRYFKTIKKSEVLDSEEQLLLLRKYLKIIMDIISKESSLLAFLKEIEKKKYLVPFLDFTSENDWAHRILNEMINLGTVESYRVALLVYNEWLKPSVKEWVKEEQPFPLAYIYHETNRSEEAIELYEKLYNKEPNNTSVINNLSILYSSYLKDYDAALALLEKGRTIDPYHENININIKSVKERIEKEKKRPQLMKERYYKKINKLQRSLLFAAYKLSGEEAVTDERLQAVTKLNDHRFFKQNIKVLIDLELISYDHSDGYELDKTVYEMVENYINPKIEREVVRASSNTYYRPIFFHDSEIRLYQALIELFPQQLVFPNMDLKAIIEVDKIKQHLDPDVLDYMFKAHVDFAIINNTTYLPILCIEKDSEFQDKGQAAENAAKKNLIFNTSGLPLIRVRFNSAMDPERLREEIKQATKEFLLLVQNEDDKNGILKEFDLKRFGIYTELPDDEELYEAWKEIVGVMLYDQTSRIELNRKDSILTITLSSSVEQVIDYGKESIKAKLYYKFPALNSVVFLFQ